MKYSLKDAGDGHSIRVSLEVERKAGDDEFSLGNTVYTLKCSEPLKQRIEDSDVSGVAAKVNGCDVFVDNGDFVLRS